MARYIDPAIADMQFEWSDARQAGHRWRARWCHAVHLLALLQIIAIRLALRTVSTAPQRTVQDGYSWRRAVTGAAVAVCVITAALAALTISNMPPPSFRPALVLYLLPSVLPLTVPAGLAITIALAISSRAQARRAAARVLGVAGAMSIAALLTLGWGTPLANQAYRETVFGGPLAPGFNELPLPELRRRLAENTPEPGAAAEAAMSYQSRLAVSFAAVPLSLFALAMCGRSRLIRLAAAVVVSGLYFSLYVLLPEPAETLGGLPAALIAWLPNIGSAIIALVLWRLPSAFASPSRST